MPSLYHHTFTPSQGESIPLSTYAGKVILIVNTATQCGLAPQFAGLEHLHQTYRDTGLVVLGFPCDQFLHQEPESDASMAHTCQIRFGVTFPLSRKIEVNGEQTDPLFADLKQALPGGFLGLLGGTIKWNFTKFLVNRQGLPVKRYAPTIDPLRIEKDIQRLLRES